MQYRRGVVSMFVFLTMLTLYPDGRLTGFALATKTSGAAKVYWKRLNSKKKVSVLKWASESEYLKCPCGHVAAHSVTVSRLAASKSMTRDMMPKNCSPSLVL